MAQAPFQTMLDHIVSGRLANSELNEKPSIASFDLIKAIAKFFNLLTLKKPMISWIISGEN